MVFALVDPQGGQCARFCDAEWAGPAIGFSALVLWLIDPLTWCVGFFVLEGLLRLLAAAITEQTVATLPLVAVDWIYGKLSGGPPEGAARHLPSAKEQLREFVSSVKQGVTACGLPKLEDECKEVAKGDESFLEIRASHARGEWIPPRVVKAGDAYFRPEEAKNEKAPRPFIHRLKRLPAGVPGRTVIVYRRPPAMEKPERRVA